MTSARRLAAVLCLLALAALGLSACGSSSSKSSAGAGIANASATDVIRGTFSHDTPLRSGRLDATLNLDVKGGSGTPTGPVAVKLSGPFKRNADKKPPSFDLDLSYSAGATTFAAGAVSTGDRVYLKLQGKAFDLGSLLSGAVASLGSLGLDPLSWVKQARRVGDANVDGADTVHVTAGIDVAKLLHDVNGALGTVGGLGLGAAGIPGLPRQISADTRRQIVRSVKSATFDLYSAKSDGTLRRLSAKLALALGNASLVADVTDANQSQTISAPKNAQPITALLTQMQGLLGGLLGGGSGGSGGSGSGSGGGASAGSSAKYLDCVTKAGQDVAKVQKCASLLGP